MTAPRRGFTIARLMPPDLPQSIEPARLARQAAHLSGSLPLAGMQRLSAQVPDTDGKVEFALAFFLDEAGNSRIDGNFSTRVTLVCQRCLQPMPWPVRGSIRLGVVHDREAAQRLPAGYEPLQLTGETGVSLSELIEDEVLLALPFAPLHGPEDCPAAVAPVSGATPATTHRPFAQLIELKRRRKE